MILVFSNPFGFKTQEHALTSGKKMVQVKKKTHMQVQEETFTKHKLMTNSVDRYICIIISRDIKTSIKII